PASRRIASSISAKSGFWEGAKAPMTAPTAILEARAAPTSDQEKPKTIPESVVAKVMTMTLTAISCLLRVSFIGPVYNLLRVWSKDAAGMQDQAQLFA